MLDHLTFDKQGRKASKNIPPRHNRQGMTKYKPFQDPYQERRNSNPKHKKPLRSSGRTSITIILSHQSPKTHTGLLNNQEATRELQKDQYTKTRLLSKYTIRSTAERDSNIEPQTNNRQTHQSTNNGPMTSNTKPDKINRPNKDRQDHQQHTDDHQHSDKYKQEIQTTETQPRKFKISGIPDNHYDKGAIKPNPTNCSKPIKHTIKQLPTEN